MNEPRSHPNERDSEDRLAKKGLKELKVTTYTNKMHLQWLNHRNSKVKRVFLGVILCWVTSWKFSQDACE